MIAYCELLGKTGENAVPATIGDIHDEAKYVLDRYNITYPKSVPNSDDFDRVILVDASDIIGTEGKVNPNKVIEIIDHRKINDAEKFLTAKTQIELVGAAATLITEKFIKNQIDISKSSAILLYAAIISNTLNFKGSLTTERDKTAAKYLNDIAKLPDNFWKELFLAKSDLFGDKLIQRINGDFAWFIMGGKRVGIAQIEMIGADKLVQDRKSEILKALDILKSERNLDYIFQNMIELGECKNIFVTKDDNTITLLERTLDVKFNNSVAERSNLIMRKQIVPIIRQELMGNT
jgi:manganese-dependent inorganic pyrophosphatase